MNSSTAAILCHPLPSDHIVYSYADDNDLVDAVTLFASAGLAKKEAVILVVTAKHADVIRRRVEQEGFNLPELQESGRLVFADAADVLHRSSSTELSTNRSSRQGSIVDRYGEGASRSQIHSVRFIGDGRSLNVSLRFG
jgi:hypothetical protein